MVAFLASGLPHVVDSDESLSPLDIVYCWVSPSLLGKLDGLSLSPGFALSARTASAFSSYSSLDNVCPLSPLDLSFDKVIATANNVLKRFAKGPEDKNGLAAPNFQQLFITTKARPDALAGHSSQANRRPANKGHRGDRRVQGACEEQLTAHCLPPR